MQLDELGEWLADAFRYCEYEPFQLNEWLKAASEDCGIDVDEVAKRCGYGSARCLQIRYTVVRALRQR